MPSLPIEPDRRRAEELVARLMAIPGRSGEEGEVSAFIRDALLRAGLPPSALLSDAAHRRSPFGGQTGNLIAHLPGSVRGPSRLLMAHLDTVPICVGSRPVRRGRRMLSADTRTGLGGDDRSGAALLLVAALEILERRLAHPPLTLLWCVQEEVGLIGSRFVSLQKLRRPKLAFNFDGGLPAELVIGATGATRMTIRIGGIAAHAGGHPERGVSAIVIAARAISQLDAEGWHGLVRKGARRGTSNAGVLHAGEATNVVTDAALLRAEARSHDPRFRRRIVAAYRKAFKEAAAAARNHEGRRGRVLFETTNDYESFVLAKTEPCVAAAAAAARAAGAQPTYRISNGGLDANWMYRHGIPTVTLGTGQVDIHTVREALDLDQFHLACRIGLLLATGATQPPAADS
jgi:tripeptide aminopeptidase